MPLFSPLVRPILAGQRDQVGSLFSPLMRSKSTFACIRNLGSRILKFGGGAARGSAVRLDAQEPVVVASFLSTACCPWLIELIGVPGINVCVLTTNQWSLLDSLLIGWSDFPLGTCQLATACVPLRNHADFDRIRDGDPLQPKPADGIHQRSWIGAIDREGRRWHCSCVRIGRRMS